jgi:pimeloyl-ACP methyl ester carboxylesterase
MLNVTSDLIVTPDQLFKGEINHPTLVIHGTDDLIWHFKHSGVLLEKIKGSKLLSLEGTGHELHFEDWNTIIEGIDKHIKEEKQ